jgi:hypothetical protein
LSTDFICPVSSSPGLTNSTHGTGLVYKFPAKLLLISLSRHGQSSEANPETYEG